MDNFTENVSKHFGLPWTGLIEHCRKTKKDKPPDQTARVRKQPAKDVTSKLQREDASTFGLRPALDEFLLTQCDQCGAVIKPQALYSHIERRHKNSSGESSVQHLLTEKPIVKGLSFKSKNKSSPRNSPKLTSNCDTNLLDKYKLPKPPVNRIGGKFAPGSLEQSNSALAKQLRSCGVQPVVALDDVSLTTSIVNPSNVLGRSESLTTLALTPKSSLTSTSNVVSSGSKQFTSKRSLESSLGAFSKSEPPKKLKLEPVSDTHIKEETQVIGVVTCSTENDDTPTVSTPSPQDTFTQSLSPKPIFSISETETAFINTTEPPKSSPKYHQITTFDKSIPCKDREYDPNRHCGCWLEEWGKHCTRSLTCKSHALSLRRKVAGRSKPFDTLLLEHREAKEALHQNKAKLNRKKPLVPSSSIPSNKLHRTNSSNTVASIFGDSDMDSIQSAHSQTDHLGYSPFHPRPLATPCYGVRRCGSSYVPNRQMNALRVILKQAIEKPRQSKKLCSTKNVKSVTGGASRASQLSHALSASSLALFQTAQSAAKIKSLPEKKSKKAKRSVSADSSKAVHPPFSHRMASPPSVPASPSQCLTLSDSMSTNLPLKSGAAGTSTPTINLLTNGATTQLIRANLLKDVGIWPAGRQKGNPVDVNKTKLNNRNSIHLPTNPSGIATLSNKQLTLLDGRPYTLYSASRSSSSKETSAPAAQPVLINTSDILSRAANGIVMQSSAADRTIDNHQSAVLELIPQRSNAQPSSQLNSTSIQYIKSDSNLNAEPNYLQTSSDKVAQQFTISNGAAFNSIRAMQLKQQNKPASTVTRPLGSQPALGQQQTLHHSSPTAATAHHGYG